MPGPKRKKQTISSSDFYAEWSGHPLPDLHLLWSVLQSEKRRPTIWLAGDSSLDNKAWLDAHPTWVNAVNGYEQCLKPPRMKRDIAFGLNELLEAEQRMHNNLPLLAVNCAIEATSLGQRTPWLVGKAGDNLLEQDLFIRDHIAADDVLVVSIGGNDIALRPTPATIANVLALVKWNSEERLEQGPDACWGMKHFIKMFRRDVRDYVKALIGKAKPRAVIIAMIYFPDESDVSSWANLALSALGYNSNPGKVQAALRTVYKHATQKIKIKGTTVIPTAWFDVLDCKPGTRDYVARVEPSEVGGRKMAQHILDCLNVLDGGDAPLSGENDDDK